MRKTILLLLATAICILVLSTPGRKAIRRASFELGGYSGSAQDGFENAGKEYNAFFNRRREEGPPGANGAQAAMQPAWDYSWQADEMGRGTTEFASLESVNKVSFDFPYNGGSEAILTLRNSPKYGREVLFDVTRGQFLCDSEDCHVNVRVDVGPLVRVDANRSADGSSNVIFLPYSPLVRDLARAKILRIEASFYQEGSRVFEFRPQGLDVKKLATIK